MDARGNERTGGGSADPGPAMDQNGCVALPGLDEVDNRLRIRVRRSLPIANIFRDIVDRYFQVPFVTKARKFPKRVVRAYQADDMARLVTCNKLWCFCEGGYRDGHASTFRLQLIKLGYQSLKSGQKNVLCGRRRKRRYIRLRNSRWNAEDVVRLINVKSGQPRRFIEG